MNSSLNPIDQLAKRARAGDLAAVAELRSQLEPHLTRILRRAMRGGPRGAVPQGIRDHLDRLGWSPDQVAPASDSVVGPVADNVCASIVGALTRQASPVQRLKETVLC